MNDADQATGEALDIVVGDIEQAVLKVEELARDVDRDDLPRAVADQLLAEGETL